MTHCLLNLHLSNQLPLVSGTFWVSVRVLRFLVTCSLCTQAGLKFWSCLGHGPPHLALSTFLSGCYLFCSSPSWFIALPFTFYMLINFPPILNTLYKCPPPVIGYLSHGILIKRKSIFTCYQVHHFSALGVWWFYSEVPPSVVIGVLIVSNNQLEGSKAND
jgi:hypothetical protein